MAKCMDDCFSKRENVCDPAACMAKVWRIKKYSFGCWMDLKMDTGIYKQVTLIANYSMLLF